MLASINPLGERARRTRWGRTLAWYTIGSTLGGAAVGAVGGALGVALRSVLSPSAATIGIAALVACVTGALLDLGVAGLRVPSVHRQVNENWLVRYRGWVYGTGFGVQLGAGVVTIVTTSTVYVTLVFAVLAGSLWPGLLIGATFGLVRAVPLVAVGRVHDAQSLRRVLRRAHGFATVSRAAGVGCLLIVGAVSVAAVLL